MRSFVQIRECVREVKVNKEKRNILFVYPTFSASGKDLMKKGGKFYAILDKDTGMWCTDEGKVVEFVDRELIRYIKDHYTQADDGTYYDGYMRVKPELLDDSSTNKLKDFNTWLTNLSPNHNYIQLDTELTKRDEDITPDMYRSKRLSYVIQPGSTEAYDALMSTLYSDEDRQKIEWCIGAIYTGASKKIEKILVLYGKPGSGKSTILDLVKALFDGYWVAFVASELVSKNHQFSTAAFKDNPLLAIQDDGNMAKIDSPVINEIVSHKDVMINEKGKQQYFIRSNAFLLLATNQTVDIQDRRMGMARRLLDVYPSGRKLPEDEYDALVGRLKFEYGAIAAHCISVFKSLGKNYYTNYIPEKMIDATSPVQNFLCDTVESISAKPYWARSELYKMFKIYCEESGINYPVRMTEFGEQLKDYFNESYKFKRINGIDIHNVFIGLRTKMVLGMDETEPVEHESTGWLTFDSTESLLDKLYSNQPAQYPKEDGSPKNKWDNVRTKLKDIDKTKLYWAKFPENVIKMDFDLTGPDGEKSLEENIKAANNFPPTYAELSKSGQGIHLYYIYDGDPSELDDVQSEHIEIKKSYGNRAHRRLMTKCNSHDIAHISSGLRLKSEKGDNKRSVFDEEVVLNEGKLRALIKKCVKKEVHADTRSNIDFICKLLNDAYVVGLKYDVSDMRQDVLIFAMNSTHQSDYCVNKVGEMKFSSEEGGSYNDNYDPDAPIIFFDYEVFPNLVLLCWKYQGEEHIVHKIFNPTVTQIQEFIGMGHKYRNKLIGFNNKDYDNHITYAILMGKTTYEIFTISQALINGEKGSKFREAYNLSYSDIFDFMPEKIGLKKWEIRLGIHHQELGFKWDEPVPEDKWDLVASYCVNDVIATEAVFMSKAGQAAWKGRCILCDLANILMGPGSTVNDSTNTLTTKLIVGNDRNPQSKYVYPDLSKEFPGYEFNKFGIDPSRYISKDVIITGKSIYKGYDPGEGGFVWAQHGAYGRSISFDSASHHPSSLIAENGFGEYTPNFKRLLDLRLHVKHKEYDIVRSMYDGALAKYLQTDEDAGALSFALKIAINSVYGLTAARFAHPLKDPRNVDNWVAKRGALFMIDLMLNVRAMGYTVEHCKTDSIKVLNPDERVANYIYEYGKKFGYTFEVEHIFDRLCLVNDAVYVCKYTNDRENGDKAGKWDATGKQFQIPYVFKALFSHEPIEFEDMCEVKKVTSALYLDYNEGLPEGEHNYCFIGKTGQFTPIKPGCGGARLLREASDGKYAYAESSKGYMWLESEDVKKQHKEADVDTSFYEKLVDKAREKINEFANYEEFVSDAPFVGNIYDFMNIPENAEEEMPFN